MNMNAERSLHILGQRLREGTNETHTALRACEWRDETGEEIISGIEQTVSKALNQALAYHRQYCLTRENALTELERAIDRAQAHLRR